MPVVCLLKLLLGTVGLTDHQAEASAGRAEGWSFADVGRACDNAVRTMALDDREQIAERDVLAALEELQRRELPPKDLTHGRPTAAERPHARLDTT